MQDVLSFSGLKVNAVDVLRDSRWDEEALQHPQATVFHTSDWAKILKDTYGHTPHYLRFARSEKVVALVPLVEVKSWLTGVRGVCLPFADYCEPLWFEPNLEQVVIEKLREVGRQRGWSHVEIRGSDQLSYPMRPAVTFCAHIMPLGGLETLATSLSSPVRRAIRKATHSGLSTMVLRNSSGLRDYYRLHLQTRRRHGAPPQPYRFFENIHEALISRGAGFYVVGYLDQRPIAAAVFLHTGANALYKFGASDESVQHLRGNNLVMWEGIQTLSKLGCKTLHFGRTTLTNDGLRQFKRGFGPREFPLVYFRIDPETGGGLEARDRASGWQSKIFRALPVFANVKLGNLLYPHLD
jgi:lipid II:glycine glycyltransferase (peptidoglycan interpeptide bridge formation enzyme)